MCVACFSATFVSSMGVAVVFARQDIRRIVPNGPLLTASYAEFLAAPVARAGDAPAGPPMVSMLIRNNADFELWLLGDGVILSTEMGLSSIKAHIVNERLRAGVIHLRPGEGAMIDVAAEGYSSGDRFTTRDGGSESNALGNFFYPFNTPGNEKEMIIHFSSVNADGTLGEVNAVLLADEGRRADLRQRLAADLAAHR